MATSAAIVDGKRAALGSRRHAWLTFRILVVRGHRAAGDVATSELVSDSRAECCAGFSCAGLRDGAHANNWHRLWVGARAANFVARPQYRPKRGRRARGVGQKERAIPSQRFCGSTGRGVHDSAAGGGAAPAWAALRADRQPWIWNEGAGDYLL